LYPASFPSEKPLPRDFVYTLKGVAEGEYLYFDEYTRTMRGSIVVVAYDNPWFTHPGGAGVVAAGPTRIVGARVAPTRQNPTANQITPASVTAVRVEVALAGTGAAKLGAKLRSGNLLAGPACAAGESSTVRDVDGGKQRLEVFEIDASSLADGQLSFELELDGETYIVPGPVTKRTAVQSFANEHKSVVNVNLS
jgi:hypothetical protein